MAKSIWTLDPSHTLFEFSVKHMMISTVKGRFDSFTGRIEGDLPDLTTATLTATVAANSITTGDAQRDGHLRTADFFEVEHHPELTFVSKNIERSGEDEYRVTGDLTMRGITREVVLAATFEGQGKNPYGMDIAAISLEGKVNRKDWGLNWNVALEAGGILVSELVRISVHAELIKQADSSVA